MFTKYIIALVYSWMLHENRKFLLCVPFHSLVAQRFSYA